MSEWRDLRGCKYLYLKELGEPEENALGLVLLEAKSGLPAAEGDASAPFSGVSPIDHSAGCRVFELNWSSYIAYSVRNESYTSSDEYEKFEGDLFRVYSKSRYLDFIATSTIARADYPGPFRHWGVACLNHVIDVVSTAEPSVNVSVAA